MGTAHGEINGHVEDARAFRKVHAQKENVAPPAMRQVHAYRRTFAQDREKAAVSPAQDLGAQAQGAVRGVPRAEHPLIAAQRANAMADLVGKRLESQSPV